MKSSLIKEEDLLNDEQNKDVVFYCFNPYCQNAERRAFLKDEHHFNLQNCKKWIINDPDNIKQQMHLNNNITLQHLQVKFEKEPISSLKKLRSFARINWKEKLEQQKNKIQISIVSLINRQFKELQEKITIILQKTQIYEQALAIINEKQQINQKLFEFFKKETINFEEIPKLFTISMVLDKQIMQNIQLAICKIQESFLKEVDVQTNKTNLFSNLEQRCFYEFIFDGGENQFNKLQTIASCFNTQPKNYLIKENVMSLECFLCQRKLHQKMTHSNRKDIKKHLAEQIVIHLYCSHYQEVCFKYTRKQLKSHLIQLNNQQFFHQSKYFQIVYLVDRQSGVTFQQDIHLISNGQPTYCIDLLTLKNKAMAKGKYILKNNREDIDVSLIVMAYECHRRSQKVYIQSKKITLVEAIYKFLERETSETEESKKQAKEECANKWSKLKLQFEEKDIEG